jgi:hypothetical protein
MGLTNQADSKGNENIEKRLPGFGFAQEENVKVSG